MSSLKNNKFITLINANLDDIPDEYKTLFIACMTDTVDEIKKLINPTINLSYGNKYGNNCLMLACRHNPDISVIRYLIEDLGMDPQTPNRYGSNSLMSACRCSSNVEIVRYLIENLKVDPKIVDSLDDNCLLYACWENPNLDIIKWLIEDLAMDYSIKNKLGEDCFLSACRGNSNISIVKYLMDKTQNLFVRNNNQYDCLALACINKYKEIIRYLMQDIRLVHHLVFSQSTNIIEGVYNHNKQHGITFGTELTEIIELRLFRPFFTRNKTKAKKSVNIFCDYIIQNSLNEHIIDEHIQQLLSCKQIINLHKNNIWIDSELEGHALTPPNKLNVHKVLSKIIPHTFSLPSIYGNELIFKFNGIPYYGNHGLVFCQSEVLSCLLGTDYSFTDQIEITMKGVSPLVVELYLRTAYTGNWDEVEQLDYSQLIELCRIVDQYPTNLLTVTKLEYYLVSKYDSNISVIHKDFLIDLITRYELKSLLQQVLKLIEKTTNTKNNKRKYEEIEEIPE